MNVRFQVSPCRNLAIAAVSACFFMVSILACDGSGTGNGYIGCGDDDDTGTVVDTRTMVPHPSWTCGMGDGIPAPENGELVFDVSFKLGDIFDMGETQYGHRHLIEIDGGSLAGPDISAQVMEGGLDFQLTLSNGAQEIDQVFMLRTSDGEYIYFRNCGAAADQSEVRVVPYIEAAQSGDYAWLNTGTFAGVRTLDMDRKTMHMAVYDVSNVTVQPNAANAIIVEQPQGAVEQSWECRQASSSERRGDALYTETVNIGASQSVGRSKNGNRNVIPITGGTATGNIAGRVLSGGGDYQIISGTSMSLDARYTIRTNDGDLIIVRNCGPATSLVPVFETRKNGPYGYLNDALWLSSSPGIGLGSVKLTIYESE